MKLYRYEIGSDDGDEDIITGKELIGEFDCIADATNYIRNHYLPINISVEKREPIAQLHVFAAMPCNDDSDFIDEMLWLLECDDSKRPIA